MQIKDIKRHFYTTDYIKLVAFIGSQPYMKAKLLGIHLINSDMYDNYYVHHIHAEKNTIVINITEQRRMEHE